MASIDEKENFDHVDLQEDSDGSVADVEDDMASNEPERKVKTRKKKRVKKKKIYFRSDFTGEKESSPSSSEDEDSTNEKSAQQGFAIQSRNPVCKMLNVVMF